MPKKMNRRKMTTSYRRAGVGARLSAFFIDWLIQTLCLAVLAFLSFRVIIRDFDFSLVAVSKSVPLFLIAVGFSYFVTGFIYDMISDLLFDGVTVGKKLFGLRVFNNNSKKPTAPQLLKRNLIKHTADIFAGFFMVMFSRNKKSLSDIFAGTKVIAKKYYVIPDDFPIANIDVIDPSQRSRLTLNDFEYALLRELFLRRHYFDDGGERICVLLQKRFTEKLGIPIEMDEKTMTVLLALNSSLRE